MAYLTNNQMSTILKSAYEELTGKVLPTAEGAQLSLKDIVDQGDDSTDLATFKEQFTKALIVTLVKNWFTDSSYRSQYTDDFLMDNEQYGAIIQSITIEVPDVRESGAWLEWTDGTSTITTNDTIFLPKVHTKLYGLANSFELPIAITDNQWDEAFNSESGIRSLISYIFLVVDNKLLVHLEACGRMNENNFIASKIAYSQSEGATGTHVINLVKDYCDTFGITSGMSAVEFLKDADAMRWASRRFAFYKTRLAKDSVEYNVDGYHRFVPSDRLVFHVNSDFVSTMDSVVYANTFNEEYVKMAGYREVPYWQFETQGVGANGLPHSMEINVKTSDNEEINAKNVVALMSDKLAIRHVIVERRVAAQYYSRNAITQYYYQYKDKFENDLSMNAIVFVIDDVEAQ